MGLLTPTSCTERASHQLVTFIVTEPCQTFISTIIKCD